MIEKHPIAVDKYAHYVNSIDDISNKQRLIGYMYFLKLLITDNRINKIKIGEYEDSEREDVEKIIGKLMKYDVISFDIFDTLILRMVEKPEDVFNIIGLRKNITGFAKIRKSAEAYCYKQHGSKTTINDIYARLHAVNGLDSAELIDEEFSVEEMLVTPNPYMKKIYEAMVAAGKKVIIVSDMYWPSDYMEKILAKCGYSGWNHLYVSCDYDASKYSGKLYELVIKDLSSGERVIHIGDNYNADIKNAKKKKINTLYYKSVGQRGEKYRHTSPSDRSVGVSVANALVNNEIHNGISLLNRYEKYGYIYGGILVAGYCDWINKVAAEKNVDKLLFLARDAEVMYNSYKDYFCKYDCEYVYGSRRSVLLLVFEKYPELFVERILKERAEEYNMTIEDTLKESHMDCIIDRLSEINLNKDDIFNLHNYTSVAELIYRYKNDILNGLDGMLDAARKYWQNVIGNNKTIAFVDVGRRGTIPVVLNLFFNHVCNMNVKVYSIQIGTRREEWNKTEYEQAAMLSYCCSSDYNTRWNDYYNYDLGRIIIVETLFSSNANSLLEYELDKNGQCQLKYQETSNKNEEIINSIHNGIDLFVKQYRQVENALDLTIDIAGENAIKPIFYVKNSDKYICNLFKDYQFRRAAGGAGADVALSDYLKRNGYL
jgi:HAD superfamily hydrolase (TIGR01549 family)